MGRSDPAHPRARARYVLMGITLAALVGLAIWAARSAADTDLLLTAILTASALVANVLAPQWDGRFSVSGSFMASMLAVAFLGPAPAMVVAATAELGAWAVERYRLPVLPINVLASAAPNVVGASLFAAFGPTNTSGAGFFALLGGIACLALVLNVVIVTALMAALDGERVRPRLRRFHALVPAWCINVALTLVTAAIYVQAGIAGALFVLVSILAYTYMARLVIDARRRTREYASLSWGVLSSLLRTMDQRDPRAARHAAAVAAFARDIAEAVGMSGRDCELAHTAGLLHDIGGFGLSDRVMERGRMLTEQDWEGIRRHPEMGAELLRDLGVYGNVSEIVLAHHERVDGRGYPRGLEADEIPELAKIVSVAEIYDTLTAQDTYRTPMSSFEALTELRRVSGSQLDARYVEALADLLSGRGVEYRHAHQADFDRELDVERRINQAVESADPSDTDEHVAAQ